VPAFDQFDAFLDARVRVFVGDITSQRVDAIVNAANSTLLGGGGVDGAIHLRGGPRILAECRKLRASQFARGLPAGQAVATAAGDLFAKYVIHTVAPITRPGREPDAKLLDACYRNSLAVAAELGLRTIAFPAIGTGAYGYPREQAAPVVSSAIESFLHDSPVFKEIRLVFWQSADARTFVQHHTFSSASS
jgi:O-acetyl-ADP-ribose deacetylase (regulator of RNase III)